MTGGPRRIPRGSLVVRSRVGVCVGVACALTGFAACKAYDNTLLVAPRGTAESGTGGAASGGIGATSGGDAAALGGDSNPDSSDASAETGGGASGAAGEAGASGSTDGGRSGGSAGTGGSGGAGGVAGTNAGGAGGSGGAAATGGTASGGAPGLDVIDDFEDQDDFLLFSNKRNGSWYEFNDGTAGTQGPLMIVALPAAEARAGSTAGLHMTAQGFTGFGAGVGADFLSHAANTKKVAYDVSAYSAIRFYALVASGTQSSLKLLIPTTYSDADGGKCSDSVANKHCGDHFFCMITSLKTSWAIYQCNFSDLRQQGSPGALPQTSFDPTTAYSVQFTLATTKVLTVDIWIDDVAFVLK